MGDLLMLLAFSGWFAASPSAHSIFPIPTNDSIYSTPVLAESVADNTSAKPTRASKGISTTPAANTKSSNAAISKEQPNQEVAQAKSTASTIPEIHPLEKDYQETVGGQYSAVSNSAFFSADEKPEENQRLQPEQKETTHLHSDVELENIASNEGIGFMPRLSWSLFQQEFLHYIEQGETSEHSFENEERDRVKQNTPSLWSLSMTGGAQISIPGKLDYGNQQEAKNVTSSSLLSPSIHFGVQRSLANERFALGTGFQYSQLGESVTFETRGEEFRILPFQISDTSFEINDRSYEIYDSTFIQGRWHVDTTLVIQIDTQTTITHQVKDSLVSDSVTYSHQGKNSYNYFEVPIYLSYTVLNRPAWKVHVNPGISLGFASIRSHSLNPYLAEDQKANSNKWMVTALLYADIERRITPNLWMHLGAGTQYTLYSGLKSGNNRRNYGLIQSRFGLTYRF
ncbi:hypothetical protein KFE98_21155 [bacterium SCSIO 12741]|nr:hypothetical protein KFE98_21155 [bacterium SCSIO 12741]